MQPEKERGHPAAQELNPFEQLLKSEVKPKVEQAVTEALKAKITELEERLARMEMMLTAQEAKAIQEEMAKDAQTQARAFAPKVVSREDPIEQNSPIPERRGEPWSNAEIGNLKVMRKKGMTVREIAKFHQRSERAIVMMLERIEEETGGRYRVKVGDPRRQNESRSICPMCGDPRCRVWGNGRY